MESKCECERNDVIIGKCTCDKLRTVQGINSSNSSGFNWEQNNSSNTKLKSSLVSISIENRNSANKYSLFKDMASCRHTATSYLPPCISVRRLNRTYSEQRIRCLLMTLIAFCLGISVGALLPFFFPPADIFSLPAMENNGITESLVSTKDNFPTTQRQPLPDPAFETPFVRALQIVDNVESASYLSVSLVDNSLNTVPLTSQPAEDKSQIVPLVDGIFWSDWVESLLPRGFSDDDVILWRSLVENSTVSDVESGCGRMQNRLITYENGQKACCRYRQNFDQIQGEIFSFYLSQLLGIKNLAPSAMDVIDSKAMKWNRVQDEVEAAQWINEKPVVLTQFVNNLSPAFIPTLLRSSTRRVHPVDLPPLTITHLSDSDPLNSTATGSREHSDITELAQWSDLIVFDYLTANLDRMVNNLYNLQWNPSMMEAPAHNLAKDVSTGLLVFLDNESGLLHGYRLLDKYEHYHRLMLDSLCVFRKSTVEAIEKLHAYGSIQPLFKSMLSQFKRSQLLPMIPEKSIKVLNQRIDTVYRQIHKCQSLYSNGTGNTKSNVQINSNNYNSYKIE